MAEDCEKKSTRRTEVRELPRAEKELSKDEQKKVKGGVSLSLEVGLSNKPKQ